MYAYRLFSGGYSGSQAFPQYFVTQVFFSPINPLHCNGHYVVTEEFTQMSVQGTSHPPFQLCVRISATWNPFSGKLSNN